MRELGSDAALERLRDRARKLLDRAQAVWQCLEACATEDTRHDHLDQARTGLGDGASKRGEQRFGGVDTLGRHAEPRRDLHEVEVRSAQVKLRLGLRAGGRSGAYAL